MGTFNANTAREEAWLEELVHCVEERGVELHPDHPRRVGVCLFIIIVIITFSLLAHQWPWGAHV